MPTIEDFPWLAAPLLGGGTSSYTDYPAAEAPERYSADADPWVMPGTLCPPGSHFDLQTMSCQADLEPGGGVPNDPNPSPGSPLPPLGDEPVYGMECSTYNMDPMAPDDPRAAMIAKGAGLPFKYGTFPFCTPKGGTAPTPGGGGGGELPQLDLPGGGGYVSQSEHDEQVAKLETRGYLLMAGGVAVGALVGGLVGHAMKRRR